MTFVSHERENLLTGNVTAYLECNLLSYPEFWPNFSVFNYSFQRKTTLHIKNRY